MDQRDDVVIGSEPCPVCNLCGSSGILLYSGLRDHLFGAAGTWSLVRCSNPACRLNWLDPMPNASEIHKAYAAYHTHTDTSTNVAPSLKSKLLQYATGYLEARYGYRIPGMEGWPYKVGRLVAFHPAARATLDFSVFYLPAVAGGRLLEIGCGNGRMLADMQARGWSVEGLDPDPSAVRQARAKGLNVRLGNLAEQNYEGEHFDAIVMSHVIEHVPAPLQLFRECNRLLKPGGKLVVMTPNADSWGHRHYRQHWRGLEPPRHLFIFNPFAMRLLVQGAGFRDFKIKTTVHNANSMFLASGDIKRKALGDLRSKPWHEHYLAKFMQLMEWTLIQLKPNSGEELILIANKSMPA